MISSDDFGYTKRIEVGEMMLEETRDILSRAVEDMRAGLCSSKHVQRAAVIVDGVETALVNGGYDISRKGGQE